MKSLKRTLSLVLALVMVLGMFGIASAAGFKDEATIKNTEAVQTNVALNIINGRDDGTFDPTGAVKRSEMAKMICIALNGGVEPVLGTSATPMFSDIKGHWAQKYIEYCSSLGIIAGMGDGTFVPDASVTGSQAAKMMLVAMNYNAKVFGFEGPTWEINANVEANKAGLYEDLKIDASAALNRDNAAQLIYNGIFAPTMQRTWSQDPASGKITETYALTGNSIATDKFSLDIGYGEITNVKYNPVTKKYDHKITQAASSTAIFTEFATVAEYSSLLEMNAKILYKDNTDGSVTVYGAYPVKSSVVLAGVLGQMSEAKWAAGNGSFTLNGTTYKVHTTVAGTAFNTSTTLIPDFLGYDASGSGAAVAPFAFKALDTDGNNTIDKVIVYPYSVHKVTYVGADQATISNVAPFPSVGSIDLEDDVVYSGIAKGDYVKMTASANSISGKNTFEKINLMEGTVTKRDGVKVLINGIWFVDTKSGTAGALTLGSTYEDIAQVNTFIFDADESSSIGSAADYAVLIKGVASANNGLNGDQAKVLFSDGTIKTVDTATDYSNAAWDNAFVTFSISATTGDYTFSHVSDEGAFDDYNATAAYAYASTGGTLAGNAIDDAAVIFVNAGASGYKVMTGAQFKVLATASVTGAVEALTKANSSTGFSTVMLAYADITSTAAGSSVYGYVTKVVTTLGGADGKTPVSEITFWNGTEEVTKTTATTTVSFGAGTVITYALNADGTIVANPAADLVKSAVTAFDGTNLRFNDAAVSTAISDKTVIFYIDSSAKKGVAGGEIQLADEPTPGNYTNNAYYIDGGATTTPYKLVVVDTKNDMASQASVTLTAATHADATAINAAFDTYDSVTVTGTLPTTGITIPAGKTLKVTTTQAIASLVTIVGTDATSKLVLDAASTGDASDATFVDKAGTAYNDSTAVPVPADIYTWVSSAWKGTNETKA